MSNEWTVEEEKLVEVSVNGEYFSDADASEKLGDVVRAAAQSNGLRTINVFVNGAQIAMSQAGKTLAELGADSIEIRTKDQRA